jgi:hypothetical protein
LPHHMWAFFAPLKRVKFIFLAHKKICLHFSLQESSILICQKG